MGLSNLILGQPQRIEEPFRRKRSKKINKRNPSVNKKIDALLEIKELIPLLIKLLLKKLGHVI